MAEITSISVTDPGSDAIEARFQYTETDRQTGIKQVSAMPDSAWTLNPGGSATFGITSSAYWLRFAINNQTSKQLQLIAELAYPQLDDVRFYIFSNGVQVRHFATGDARPFYPREVDHPNNLLRFDLSPGQSNAIYVRVETAGSMILPLQLWRENRFFENAADAQKLHFFYYGCLSIIILINLAVFVTLRERLYLYYSLAILGYLVFFASVLGYGFQHIYPRLPAVHQGVLLLSMRFLTVFSLLFCKSFLKTATQSPKLDTALRWVLYLELVLLPTILLVSYDNAIRLSALSAFIYFSLLMAAGPIRWAAGMREGVFFTIAWTPLTIGVLATAGRALGVLPQSFMTQYAMQIGSGLEAFILTLALADRLYREREDKIQAQGESLRTEKARHEASARLADAIMHDPVTQLPNRNRFELMVNQYIEMDPDGQYMVGVTRVTRLEEINRTLGLNRSERLLQCLARQMSELAEGLPYVLSLQDGSTAGIRVYQLSGDTFGLLIDPRSVDDNFEALDSALATLLEPIVMDNLAIELHPRFGAASYPAHGLNAAMLIRNAHVGMGSARPGKLHVGFYSEAFDIYSESRLTLISDLKDALSQNATELYYQPKVSLHTGKIVGVEALIRWSHPERGSVSPVDFIPLAEDTGVIKQLTRWAIERSMSDLAALLNRYPSLDFSVNISARDLVSSSLGGLIATLLQQHHLGAERLILELTETAAMEDPCKGMIAMKQLADIGLRVSIDDFGSGYSSLSYLKGLPATEIKLDQSIITDVCSSESARIIAETTINMGHSLGYQVVAEGVEDEETMRWLQQTDCDRLQGFWLCHPLPVKKLEEWLAAYQTPFEVVH